MVCMASTTSVGSSSEHMGQTDDQIKKGATGPLFVGFISTQVYFVSMNEDQI